LSETKEPPKGLAVDLGGGVKLKMTLIPAGEFKMGSGESAEATAAFFKKTYGEDYLTADFLKRALIITLPTAVTASSK